MHGKPIYGAHVVVLVVDKSQLRHGFVRVIFVPAMEEGWKLNFSARIWEQIRWAYRARSSSGFFKYEVGLRLIFASRISVSPMYIRPGFIPSCALTILWLRIFVAITFHVDFSFKFTEDDYLENSNHQCSIGFWHKTERRHVVQQMHHKSSGCAVSVRSTQHDIIHLINISISALKSLHHLFDWQRWALKMLRIFRLNA